MACRALAVCRPLIGAESSRFPPKSRLDGAVRLISGHKDLIGIVLPESREVHEQAVYVGHGQFDFVNLADFFEYCFAHGIERVLHGLARMLREDSEQRLTNLFS